MADLRLISTSAATDAAWLAAADVAHISGELGIAYRLIGGVAVTLLTHLHGVDRLTPPRETADADMGLDMAACADPRLPVALLERGYRQERSNRFEKNDDGRLLAIDILAPSYLGRLETSQRHGDLYVDEVPGLGYALASEPSLVEVDLTLTDRHELAVAFALPNVRAALILKAYAYRGRFSTRDALDIWRLLEAAYATGTLADGWPTGSAGRDAGGLLREHFGTRGGGPATATPDPTARARIRALVGRVVPA